LGLTARRLAALSGALAVAGCGAKPSAVPVTVPTVPTSPGGAACAALAKALPETLDGRARRTTRPVSDLVTAWGSPAVVLRCGVPAVRTSAGDHVDVDGVGWLTAGAVNGTVVWTTTDRTTSLELSVPESVNDQENLLGDLAPAVTGSISRAPAPPSASPVASPPPTG
jgi:Protein of unknown function (DUF3515)